MYAVMSIGILNMLKNRNEKEYIMSENRNMAGRRPCNACRMRHCDAVECPKWQMWFLESWACVNRYAWAIRDEMGREEPKNFLYGQPHEYKSPCLGCPCESWCDTPCSLRLKWWDRQMAIIRKRGEAHAAR